MPFNLSSLFLFALNFILGWLEGRNLLLIPNPELSQSIRWGFFSAESLFAVTWISLGPKPFHRRVISTLNWGLCLSIFTWLGFLLGYGSRAWIYNTEFGYVVTQLPVAVMIASTPLFLFRIHDLLVFARAQRLGSQQVSDIALLLVVVPLIAIPLVVRGFSQVPIFEDLYWACLFGAIAALVTFPIVPLIAVVFFREKLRFYWVLLPFITVVTLSQFVAASFPFPAGGGSYFAYRETGTLAFVSIAVVSILCFEKRLQGYRLLSLKSDTTL
jgi:hypothetical protein